jgi:hypothetical protein
MQGQISAQGTRQKIQKFADGLSDKNTEGRVSP